MHTSKCFQKIHFFFFKKMQSEREKETQENRDRATFHSPNYSPSWGSAGQNLGTMNSMWVSHMSHGP